MLHIPMVELQRLTDAVSALHRTGTLTDAIDTLLDVARTLLDAPAAAAVLATGVPGADGDRDRDEVAIHAPRPGAAGPPPLGACSAPLLAPDGRHLGRLHVACEPTRQAQALVDFLAAISGNLLASRRLTAEAARSSLQADAASRQLRELLDTVPAGIIVVDAAGRPQYRNGAAADLVGPLTDDLGACVGRPTDRMRSMDGSIRRWEDTALVRATQGETIRGDVLGVADADGRTTWFVTNAAPMIADDGESAGAVMGFIDITEQVELQRRLVASEARLRASERVARVGSFEIDAASLEATWSVGTYELLGIDRAVALTARDYLDMVHRDDRDRLLAAVRVTIARAAPLSLRHRLTRRDGRSRIVAVRGEAVVDTTGAVVRAVGTLRDITDEAAEQERLRRAQQLESVGRLAGGLAHDLNNFLTVLAGHAELLGASVTGSQAEHVGAIARATERAATLTRQLLEVGRREILQPQVLDVNEVVATQREMYRRVLPGTVAFECVLGDDLPPVSFDLTKLEQVLLNLVLNAADAVGVSGTVAIATAPRVLDAMSAELHELRPGAYVEISVSDDGSGMTPDVLARAFEPFFTTKGRDRGSGLGLSTSYGIMRQSDGQLLLESEPGRGTTVRLLVPATTRTPSPAPRPPRRPAMPLAGTVLVAEDDEQVRRLAVDSLTRAGCRVLEATDGPDALRLARHHAGPIDLLLTDVSMPGFGGRRLAQHLLDERPGLCVLFMSGYTEDSVVLRGVVDAGIEFLPKPFVVSDLVARAAELLSSRPTPPL